MVVIALVLLSLGVAVFIMLTDTRKNDNFAQLDKAATPPPPDEPKV
ncbi:hypothetical protein [Sandarakinorhabdus sp.]